jgi:hypothetical protein
VTLAVADSVTTTATDAAGNTSEFGANVAVTSLFSCPTVTSTVDSGPGTLRNCIAYANSNVGTTIIFDIPDTAPGYTTSGGNSWWRIAPTSALPTITANGTVIDGTTQAASYGSDTNSLGPEIEIDGSGAGAGVAGFTLTGGSGSLRGLAINRFGGDGVFIGTNGDNTILGNYIGTDVTGTVDLGNGDEGVDVRTAGNRVGGTNVSDRNVISGNTDDGIAVESAAATGNSVEGNYIGVDSTGTVPIANSANGVSIKTGASDNIVGGLVAGSANIISGNTSNGIAVRNAGTTGNTIQGNRIGTNAAGTGAVANGGDGVQITDGAQTTTVGGTTAAGRNVISGNTGDGVQLISLGTSTNTVSGNYIGTDATGALGVPNGGWGVIIYSSAQGNTIGGTGADEGNIIAYNLQDGVWMDGAATTQNPILGNLIHSNVGMGIDLDPDGVNANDAGDGDAGPNNLQNYPVLTARVTNGVTTTVTGTLSSQPTTTYWLEFYSTFNPDPLGYGEGDSFMGTASVTTNGAGIAAFTVTLPAPLPVGAYITATATDPAGNTSEFSEAFIDPPSTCPTVTSAAGEGAYTLRECINYANVNPGTTITFDIPNTDPGYTTSGGNSWWRIAVDKELPEITASGTTIDGTTQTINQGNTNTLGPEIEITSGSVRSKSGLVVLSSNNVIRGLIIGGFGAVNGNGIELSGLFTANGNAILGNYIGTDHTGTAANSNGNGIHMFQNIASSIIGGTGPGEGNVIAFNAEAGIWIIDNDSDNNLISGNSFFENGDIAIDLKNKGVTPNDAGDVDNGPNEELNFPVISGITNSGSGYAVAGSVGAGNTVQFFRANNTASPVVNLDPTGYGEGYRYITTAGALVEGGAFDGDPTAGSFRFTVPGTDLSTGDSVSTTAIDPTGNTSEFGANFVILPPSCPTVSSTADTGASTLRECINYANVNPGTTIIFNIPDTAPGYTTSGGNSWWRISPASALPAITASGTIIDGTTQAASYGTDTNSLGPEIEIDGSGAGAGVNGLTVNVPGGNATIRHLVVDNFDQSGILLQGGSTTVAGCYLGLEPDGDTLAGNNTSTTSYHGGIRIVSAGNIIGGTTVADRNVISGNTLAGIVLNGVAATGNQVLGNYIGLDAGGTQDRGNISDGEGVEFQLADSNTIGGTSADARNIISGNASDGLEIDGSSFNVIQGNYIGTDYTGTVAIPNDRDGIDINADSATGSTDNIIGGTVPGAGNLIRGNTLNGVELRDDAVVGATTTNSILGNIIYENGQLGIDLEPVGVTPNDAGDGDVGVNGLQNYPVITAVVSGGVSTTVSGTLNSYASTTFRLEFYSTSNPDPLGYGEGDAFLGTTSVTTDGAGDASFTVNFPTGLLPGDYVTATATNPTGSTSEFSANAVLPLYLFKQAFLASDGSLITNSSTLPRGTIFNFLIYTENTGPARSDVSIRDVLDSAFAYSSGSLKVDNSAAVGSSVQTIYATVNGTAALSDTIDADVASIAGSTIDVGNQFVGNGPLDILANRIWALLFTVRMQ